jgi:GTPase SAR1 family protein
MSFVPMFARGAEVAVIVFDLSRRVTFEHLAGWLSFFQEEAAESCRVIVAGNKSDLPDQEVGDWDIVEFMATHARVPCFCVSAKCGTGVEALFYEVARSVTVERISTANRVALSPPEPEPSPQKPCC